MNLRLFRQTLHKYPELSGSERNTATRIQAALQDIGAKSVIEIGKHGTLCTFHFGGGPHLLVRVDIDALPITEINDFDHKSTVEGISHKCGHDGHATIGVGLAQKLVKMPLEAGSVSILFQPAEEIGEGAKGILNDPRFDVKVYDFAVALHNIPGRPLHEILCKEKGFTPAVQSLIIKLNGKTSHAAEPLKGTNPGYAIAEILALSKSMQQTDEQHPDYNLITPVYSSLGSRDYGISAGYGEVHFTIRSWTQNRMEEVFETFKAKASKVAASHNLKFQAEVCAVFAANQNDPHLVNHVMHAAKNLGLTYKEKAEPFPWGEDFGLFTQHIRGAMFGLGAGTDTPALHNPDYDFPDEITATGVEMFYAIAKSVCNSV